ncbi:MAG: alpha/beta hydrolase, partial [Bacteroidia bacterium]|nr:alpha/beta hydrolase [Bacteroidia bacterium]
MWRLIFPVITFFLSLLTVLRAPTNLLWRLSVAITEFPYIFIFTSTVLFVLSFWAAKYKIALLGINGFALVLFIVPLIQTYNCAAVLPV